MTRAQIIAESLKLDIEGMRSRRRVSSASSKDKVYKVEALYYCVSRKTPATNMGLKGTAWELAAEQVWAKKNGMCLWVSKERT